MYFEFHLLFMTSEKKLNYFEQMKVKTRYYFSGELRISRGVGTMIEATKGKEQISNSL